MQKEDNIEALIVKSFSGDISPEENESIKVWVNESSQNIRQYQELKDIWQVIHPAFSPDEIDVDKAERKVMGLIQERKFIHSGVFILWQRVAAVLILPVIMLAAYLSYNQLNQSSTIAYQEITSPFGTSSKIDLSDGTTVWLNSGSKLRYPVVFASNERNVYLSGEAFFKVHSDKSHPFIVGTKGLNVTATGTQFNVEAYSSDSITAVTLVEGKVNVKMGGDKNVHLDPNQRIVFNSITNNYNLTETDGQHWGLWKDGILAFRDEPLNEVFKRIGRTFNVDIVIKDDIISHQLYRATFQGESFDEILRLLKISAPIKYKILERERKPDNQFNKEKIEVYKAN